MNSDASPNLDGLGANFYQFLWHIVGSDVFSAVAFSEHFSS